MQYILALHATFCAIALLLHYIYMRVCKILDVSGAKQLFHRYLRALHMCFVIVLKIRRLLIFEYVEERKNL